MASKAQRRARKRAAQGPFDLAPIPHREADGRPARGPDPASETLATRIRMNPVASERDARAPWWGCHAGRIMASVMTGNSDRLRLWDAIQHIRRTVAAYDRALGAPSRHARVAQILAPTEAMMADASSPPKDERSDEDRQRQAVAAWTRLHGALAHCDARAECLRVVVQDEPCRDSAGLIAALECVADLIAGREVTIRTR